MKHYILIPLMLLALLGCNEKNEKELKFYGNVDVRTVSLAFQVSGKLKTINFEEGQKVKQGDVLATLDASLYKEQLKQINAQIEVQKAQLTKLENGYRPEEIEKARATMDQKNAIMQNAQKTFTRYENLLATKSVAEDKYDAVKTEYESAKALYLFAKSNLELLQSGYNKEDILAAKAQLDALSAQKMQHQLNVDYTTLTSPANGTVLTRVYEVGSVVNASSVVLELAKEETYWVRSYLSERFLGEIKPGMKAHIHTDSGQNYEGVVSFISPLAEFTPKSVQTEDLRTDLVYRFRIRLDSHDEMLKQGMPVTITFPDLKASAT